MRTLEPRRAFARWARHPALSLLILALLPFLFFWRLFAPNPLDRAYLPDGDLTLQYYPLRVFAARELAAGRLPLWNPHMYAGQPGLADPQMAALYPPNVLTALALALAGRPFTFGVFQLQIVLHYALGAMGVWLFARRMTRSTLAAWVAALAFTFGGYLISYPAQQPTILTGAVWLPWALYCLHAASGADADNDLAGAIRADSRPAGLAPSESVTQASRSAPERAIIWIGLAGAALAMSLLAGHPQTFLYVFYTALAYWLWCTRRDPWRRRLAGAAGLAVCAAGLSAMQWLPTLEFMRYSTRADLGYAFTSGGFALHELITVLIPGYFGGSPLHVGFVPLLLAVAGAWHLKGEARFWAALAAAAFLLSLGDASFFYSLFYLFVPGFAQVRNQERAALLWSFALAMLAALGTARLARGGAGDVRTVNAALRFTALALAGLIALAYLGALASAEAKVNLFPGALRQLVPAFFYLLGAWALWRVFTGTRSDAEARLSGMTAARTAAWVAAGLAALVALNQFTVNGAFNFQKPTPPNYFPETPLTRALREELAAFPGMRVSSEGLLPGAHNAGAHYGFEDINGNDPLRLEASERFDRDVQELRRFQLLGVRYLVTKREITHGAFWLIAQDGDKRLYGYMQAFLRAWVAYCDVHVVPPGAEAAALNREPRCAPGDVVLNEEPPLTVPFPARPPFVADIAATPGHLTLNTDTAENALAVFGEIYYPGWQATVDGAPARILRADGILMAVALPPGTHRVELTFAPASVTIGALVSAASVLAWAAIMARGWRQRRRRIEHL